MKTSINLFRALCPLFILALTLFPFVDASAQQKPDLKISKITTIGGYYQGTCNKVRVTVTNSQQVAAKGKIPVILFVQQSGYQPVSYIAYINGIGPSDNYGQHAFFKNVKFNAGGSILLKAIVNPDQEILETVYNNNTKLRKLRAPTKKCGSTGGPSTGKGYKLQVYAYKEGTYNGPSNGQDVQGVYVKIQKGTQTYTGTTDKSGWATITGIPNGMVTIKVSKSGCSDTSQKQYMMPAHNYGKVNMDINCN